jgi:hypothetical protein
MKQCAILMCVCLLLGMAATANATTIWNTTDWNGLEVTATAAPMGGTSTTWDILTIVLKSVPGTLGSSISAIEGTWSASGSVTNAGAFYIPVGDIDHHWKTYTPETAYRTGTPIYNEDEQIIGYTYAVNNNSVVNLSGVVANATWARTQAGTSTVRYSEFSGGWYTDDFIHNVVPQTIGADVDGDGLNENVLASLRILHTTDTVTFEGKCTVNPTGGHIDPVEFTVSTVPEPGTLVLFGSGLLGLIAYAWRKRK